MGCWLILSGLQTRLSPAELRPEVRGRALQQSRHEPRLLGLHVLLCELEGHCGSAGAARCDFGTIQRSPHIIAADSEVCAAPGRNAAGPATNDMISESPFCSAGLGGHISGAVLAVRVRGGVTAWPGSAHRALSFENAHLSATK